MLAQLTECRLHEGHALGEVAAGKTLGLVGVTLFQPVLGQTGLQANVVPPAEPA